MSSALERFGAKVGSLVKTVTPFESWEESPVKDYKFTYQLLTVGDLVDIARRLRGAAAEEIEYLRKIFVLAKSIKTINGEEVVSQEDLEKYNQDHDLSGDAALSLFEVKSLFFKQLNESIVHRLAFLYDTLQRDYVKDHLGESLFNMIFEAEHRLDEVLNAAKQQAEQKIDGDEVDDSSTTSTP